MKRISFLMVLMILIAASIVCAHKVNIFAVWDKDVISGEVYFADGKFCVGCNVDIISVSGAVIASVKTADDGVFISSCNEKGLVKIVADAGAGHRAEIEMIQAVHQQNGKTEQVRKRPESLIGKGMKILLGLGIIILFFGFWAVVKRR